MLKTIHNSPVPGLVSAEAPLISNLNVLDNISLIKQYHERLSRKNAQALTLQYLKNLGFEHIAYRRNPDLNEEERMASMILRAAMVDDVIIIIDRPFALLPNAKDATFIIDLLNKIDELYEESHIFDFTWNQRKYLVSHAEKN